MDSDKYWVNRPDTAFNKSQNSTMGIMIIAMIVGVVGLLIFAKLRFEDNGFNPVQNASPGKSAALTEEFNRH